MRLAWHEVAGLSSGAGFVYPEMQYDLRCGSLILASLPAPNLSRFGRPCRHPAYRPCMLLFCQPYTIREGPWLSGRNVGIAGGERWLMMRHHATGNREDGMAGLSCVWMEIESF